jgi:ribosome-binding ATPase
MKIGIIGYQGSGKSTLFHYLTGERSDPVLVHKTHAAMATVPEPRVQQLCTIYHPKKVTLATLEMVDTPGLSRTHEGTAARLAMIREAGCLVIVVAAFDGSDPAADLQRFEEDLLIADLDIVAGRIARVEDSIKKPRPNRDELQHELQALLPMQESLEQGRPLRELELTPEQRRATKAFQLFGDKPRLIVINTSDTEDDPHRFTAMVPPGTPAFAFSLGLEMELHQMEPAERAEFCREMEVRPVDRDCLVRSIMDTSGQMLFFTAGEKEVRTWMINKGGTALEAAANIHTDLAQGFIRAETMKVADLVRLGSEREIKAHNLLRQEPKDYVIQDDDILFIRHNS